MIDPYQWHTQPLTLRIVLRIIKCRFGPFTDKLNWFFKQALVPKEKDNLDSVGGEVEDEINATAEVTTLNLYSLFGKRVKS